jgi:archaemetzincin
MTGEIIGLLGFGDARRMGLEFLLRRLEGVFCLEVRWAGNLPLPVRAYRRFQGQYLAFAFLEALEGFPGPYRRILGVTEVDLYVPGLNFVFGLARQGGRCCVVSVARLRPAFYGLPHDEVVFRSRVVKEAVHELGHTFCLSHCPNPQCVMHFSNCLADTDRKSEGFCPKCRRALDECLLGQL